MPIIPTLTSAPPAANTAATPALTALQVAVTDVSQALQNLTHSVQLTASATAVADNTLLNLTTNLGSVTVSLAALTAVERQNLLQQLMNITQAQRPLTLSLQPGSPPTQAVLLVPTSASSAALASPTTASPLPISSILNTPAPTTVSSLPPLVTGQTVNAIVLPAGILSAPPVALNNIVGTQTPSSYQQILTPAVAATVAANTIVENNGLATTPTPAPLTPAPQSAPPSATVATPALAANAATPSPTVTANNPAVPQPPPPNTAPLPAAPPSPVATQTAAAVTQPVIPASSPAPPAAASLNLAALLQPGNEVTLHIDAVIPPALTGQPPALPALAANQTVATVVGAGTDGQLILKTADAVLFVKTQVAAQIGSAVLVTVDAAHAAPPMLLPQPPAAFQTLPQAMQALAQLNPQIFQQIMATHMPQPNEVLPAALLLLFGAFKQGSLRGWLGEGAADSLTQGGHASLVAALSRELAGAGQPAQDTVVGEWRSYPIPLYAQQQFQALTLYVHNDRDGRGDTAEGADSGAKKTRFLIDMKLSKLGLMQIDGFVQPKKLDMILRSENLLPDGTHADLRQAYTKAVGAVGYAGTLNFQVGRQHWMNLRKAAAGGVVT